MLPRFLAALDQHLVELAGFLAFLVEADYAFYGVAAAFEPSFRYPPVNLFQHLLGQSKLNLGHLCSP